MSLRPGWRLVDLEFDAHPGCNGFALSLRCAEHPLPNDPGKSVGGLAERWLTARDDRQYLTAGGDDEFQFEGARFQVREVRPSGFVDGAEQDGLTVGHFRRCLRDGWGLDWPFSLWRRGLHADGVRSESLVACVWGALGRPQDGVLGLAKVHVDGAGGGRIGLKIGGKPGNQGDQCKMRCDGGAAGEAEIPAG